MIIDYFENFPSYINSVKLLEEGISFMKEIESKPAGRYERGNMFAMVQAGMTRPLQELKLEAHRNYIDVQYMAEGQEIMEWDNISKLKESAAYDCQRDIVFFDGSGAQLPVKKGMFYVAFPQDAHKPCGHVNRVTYYKKVVLKIRVE